MRVIRQNSHAREAITMKTKTAPAMGTSVQSQRKTQPITATITGSLARKVRGHAKAIGMQSRTAIPQLVEFGLLCIDDSHDGQNFREHISGTDGRPTMVKLNRDMIGLMEAILEASGTNMTVGEYIEKSIIGEVAEALLLKRLWEGVQDHIANEYALEPQDLLNMNRAAQDWASKNPEAASRIEMMNANR